MKDRALVFYTNKLYDEYQYREWNNPRTLLKKSVPTDSYIYTEKFGHWYRGDLTPVLDEDVPKELKALLLLLT